MMFWGRAMGALVGGFCYTLFPALPFILDIGVSTYFALVSTSLNDKFVDRSKIKKSGFIKSLIGTRLCRSGPDRESTIIHGIRGI